jgi:hypothetical protein
MACLEQRKIGHTRAWNRSARLTIQMWPSLRHVTFPRRRVGQLALAVAVTFALATPGRSYAQGVFGASPPPRNTLDGQLVLALPAGPSTGMSTGVGMSYTRLATKNGAFAFGARASWSTSTEYKLTEAVRDDDIRLRLCGLIQHQEGRGVLALRLSAGGTLVYENHALTGTTWSMLPAADAEGVVFLRVWESWGMSVSGGPTLHIVNSSARWGWTSGLGVLWQH